MDINQVLQAHGIGTSIKRDKVPPPPITNFRVTSIGDKVVRLAWTNPVDTDFVGVRIQRKVGSYPTSEKDGTTIYNGVATAFNDSGLVNETTYYYGAFTYDYDNNFNRASTQRTSGKPSANDDLTNAPGPKKLIGGTMQAGYFGTLPASEIFTGPELAVACGIVSGTPQFDTTVWLKFAYQGKILLRPQKAIRHSISWDAINSAGCVKGTKTVSKSGNTYKVRLMRGSTVDPAVSNGNDSYSCQNSEWNKLMLPIHEQSKAGNWAYPQFVEAGVPNWGVNFTDADLMTHNSHGNGSYVWCQEVYSSLRLIRGYNGVSSAYYYTSSNSNSDCGWAPVLEFL